MEKIGVWEVIRSFLAAYGWSFLLLVGMGLLIALLVEAIIKKSCDWLAKKWEGKASLLSALEAVRIILIQVFVWVMSIWFAILLQKGMPLPGNGVLLPFWVGLIYGCQYFFSMVGIKGLISAREAHKAVKEQAPAEPKEKLTKTEVKGVFRNSKGELVDKNNRPVKF